MSDPARRVSTGYFRQGRPMTTPTATQRFLQLFAAAGNLSPPHSAGYASPALRNGLPRGVAGKTRTRAIPGDKVLIAAVGVHHEH
jgi:hypothetical protein